MTSTPKTRPSHKAGFIASKTIFTASQGVILIAIARFEGAAEVGLYALAVAITSPIFLLTNLRVQDVLATDSVADAQWRTYLRVTAVVNAIGLLLSLLLAVVWPTTGVLAVVIPLALAKWVEALSFACHGYAQSQGRIDRVAGATVVRGLLAAAACVVGLAVADLPTALWMMLGVWLVQFLVYDARFVPWRAGRGDQVLALPVFWRLLPLGVAAALLSLNQHAIRLIVDGRVGIVALGVFATVAYTVRLGAVLARAASQASAAELRSAQLSGSDREVWEAVKRPTLFVGVVGLLLGGLIVLVGPSIFPLAFGSQVSPERPLLALVMTAGLFVYTNTTLTMAVVAKGQHAKQMWIVGCTLVVSLVLAVILTGPWGLLGAAAAWIAGESLRTLGLVALLRPRASTSDALVQSPPPSRRESP